MTRSEYTNNRDLTFSKWIREKLPDSSTGFFVTDLDFIIENWKTKKLMLVEVKTNGNYPSKGQDWLFQLLDKWIRKGIDDEWTFYGYHFITFTKTSFEDGECILDGQKKITEKELIDFLSMIEAEF